MGRVENLDWLETFVAVVDSGGFSAAAESVHRSQSRVSSHVASLEQALGARLFDRRHRPVVLTDVGEAFLPHARAVLADIDRAQAEVDAVLGVVRGHVVLGSYPSASAAFVPGVLSAFTARHPQVSVDLSERTTLDLSGALESGQIHLALRPLAPHDHTDGLAFRALWREPLVAVFPPDHPLAELPTPLPLTALVAHPLVTIGGSAGRDVRYEAHVALSQLDLQGLGTSPRIAWQTDQPQTLVNFVRTGLGVGITNALAMAVSDTTGVAVAEVGELGDGRTAGVFWNPHRDTPLAARALLETILASPAPPGTVAVPPRQPG
ncbi:LysR substrate-binding domain-containing protein [Pseudonocardia aurantiaca]|uniref:LysR family transcriptional regulator n=1 Tax=Pseudonocardia aurantiaca TaxID=75290 RepID=A0ABW4FQ52_9PSEU